MLARTLSTTSQILGWDAKEAVPLAQLAAEYLAQETQLAGGHAHVLVEDPLDVLHLEDCVAQRLSGSVVDLLGQTGAFGLLGLNDAHLHVRRQPRVGDFGDQAGVAALQEQPGVFHAPNRQFELG